MVLGNDSFHEFDIFQVILPICNNTLLPKLLSQVCSPQIKKHGQSGCGNLFC